ncbi:hypothetical protein BK126_18135 [Paenibacillus sp. FSL H7-0326]|uniref:M15 family metallopeptidase n=1 Tax=Paenibacillus sp. FSL H7-0326 TaxID=1921144 RepID=UPI00096C559D|nr:M15 family metallopeptidase [Paenibacillus sp. FSL H7-0326]OMC67502.1 hypothetical protein BK126_18135 [Paenibacillus sp. FSL H7-0326]
MKKWWIWVSMFLVLSGCGFGEEQDVKITVDAKIPIDGTSPSLQLTRKQVYTGSLVLVNKERKLHKEAVPNDIIDLGVRDELTKGFELLESSILLSEKVARKFGEMVEAAAKDGVHDFRISSGYRDMSDQEQLFEEKGEDYALPAGHSEHNLGLSLDIGSTSGPIDQSAEGNWLKKNAWNYGFILRYPKDKTNITGIQYEPWHFRYVGLPHSLIMKEKDFVLEEYLAYLKDQGSIQVEAGGETYQIIYVPAYVPVSKQPKVSIPSGSKYDVSGDNIDGYIVTVLLTNIL